MTIRAIRACVSASHFPVHLYCRFTRIPLYLVPPALYNAQAAPDYCVNISSQQIPAIGSCPLLQGQLKGLTRLFETFKEATAKGSL